MHLYACNVRFCIKAQCVPCGSNESSRTCCASSRPCGIKKAHVVSPDSLDDPYIGVRVHLRITIGVIGVLGIAACGTIMHGGSQDLGIASTPTGAQITIDNLNKGTTPMVASLSRKQNHVIHFTMDGYQPTDLNVTHSVSGWVWGNVLFGGVVGLAVDAITGGLYKLNSDEITASMAKTTTASAKSAGVYIVVVLKPDPKWQFVGQLQRAGR